MMPMRAVRDILFMICCDMMYDCRFHKADIPVLIRELRLPESLVADNGLRFQVLEGVLVLLTKMAVPNR